MPTRPIDPATGRRAVGRPPTIDRDSIGEAALAEIGHLTIAAVARRLGVAKSALYHHVEGRSDLVEMAADRALAGWRAPEVIGTPADFLAAFAISVGECLDENPGLDVALLELHDAPPAMHRTIDWAATSLVGVGAARDDALTACQLAATLALEDSRHRRALPERAWPEDWLSRRIRLVARGLT